MDKKEQEARHTDSPIGYFIAMIIGTIFWSILFTAFHKELKELINLL